MLRTSFRRHGAVDNHGGATAPLHRAQFRENGAVRMSVTAFSDACEVWSTCVFSCAAGERLSAGQASATAEEQDAQQQLSLLSTCASATHSFTFHKAHSHATSVASLSASARFNAVESPCSHAVAWLEAIAMVTMPRAFIDPTGVGECTGCVFTLQNPPGRLMDFIDP